MICIDCGREAVQMIDGKDPIYLCDRCPASPWLEFLRLRTGSEPDGPHSLPNERTAR